MRKLRTVIAAAAGAAVLLIPSPANAEDRGNGNRTCDRYEICFRAFQSHTMDSTCRVQLLDYDTTPGYEWHYAEVARDVRVDVGFELNDAHKRCNTW